MTFVFRQVERIDSGCVTYLIGSTETGECIVVDPLLDIETILSETRKQGFLRVTHVIDTHTHADHISGARNIVKMSNLSGVYMHAKAGSRFKTIPCRTTRSWNLETLDYNSSTHLVTPQIMFAFWSTAPSY